MLHTPSALTITPTYDNEGCISAIVRHPDGGVTTQPYQTSRRGGIEKCPFCGAPLYRALIQQRMYCMNNECPPRMQAILVQQLERLGVSSTLLGPLIQNGWIGNTLGPGARNLIMVAHRHPNEAIRENLLARLRNLSFTDFLMMLHVPYAFIRCIESDLTHCVTLVELHEVLLYGTPEGVAYPEAFFAGKLALHINSPYALSLLEHNRTSRPMWTEGS